MVKVPFYCLGIGSDAEREPSSATTDRAFLKLNILFTGREQLPRGVEKQDFQIKISRDCIQVGQLLENRQCNKLLILLRVRQLELEHTKLRGL